MMRAFTRRIWFIIIVGVASALPLVAQGPPPPPPPPSAQARDAPSAAALVGTGAMAGVVTVDDATKRPLARAQVSLYCPQVRMPYQTLTDAAGHFAFVNLPAARFTLSASKAGFVTAYYGARTPGIGALALPITLAEGEHVADVRVALMHGAVITGVIRDPKGRPAPNVTMNVAGARMANGKIVAEFVDAGSTLATDDRGVYRVYGLPPGGYVIGASTPGQVLQSTRVTTDDEVVWAEHRVTTSSVRTAPDSAAAASPKPGPTVRYVPVYYPGVTDPQEATIVKLGAGEERAGVDFSMMLVPTAIVSGIVVGLDGQPVKSAQIQLLSHAQDDGALTGISSLLDQVMNGRASVGADGRFAFATVRPGAYSVAVTASSTAATVGRGSAAATDLWAEQTITVNGEDLSPLTLRLQTGMTLSGRVVYDGAPSGQDVTRLRVSVSSTNSQLRTSQGANVNSDGTFTIVGIAPGTYELQAYSLAGMPALTWAPRDAMSQGKDLLAAPFEVRASENLADVVVTLTDKVTEVTGTFMDSAGKPSSDYAVMIFPADRSQWRSSSRYVRAPVRPDNQGKFSIKGLPPGDYYICALVEPPQNAYYDPALLEALIPGAIKFSLAEGQVRKQDMKVLVR
jgi:hypothetical protein